MPKPTTMYRVLSVMVTFSLLGCSSRFEPRDAMSEQRDAAPVQDSDGGSQVEGSATDDSEAPRVGKEGGGVGAADGKGGEIAVVNSPETDATEGEPAAIATGPQLATFGAGCFWCVEAVLEQLDGVLEVGSGYMGGSLENPTYKAVCSETTGHAEVVQARFDPQKISYETLLEYFWKLHDPTTLNRQGNDVGTRYRSVIFYHSEEQRALAEKSKAAAVSSFSSPIVTEITAASAFYVAEGYHQDYYRLNKSQGYCRFVIAPKLGKLGLEQ